MSNSRLSLKLCHLYPDLLNLYGDRGNIITFQNRCKWRGIELQLHSASLGDAVEFGQFDLVFIGGGSDKEQTLLFKDFLGYKGPALVEAAEEGLPLLSICGGYQLLGRYYKTHAGDELPGLSLFDAWTEAGNVRLIGNVVAKTQLADKEFFLVGFENHSGRTFLGNKDGISPLAQVVTGHGNNGQDRSEGAVYKNAIGTYLHGPLLPKNPAIADWLLSKALGRRYGDSSLSQLPDHWEHIANKAAVHRFGKAK